MHYFLLYLLTSVLSFAVAWNNPFFDKLDCQNPDVTVSMKNFPKLDTAVDNFSDPYFLIKTKPTHAGCIDTGKNAYNLTYQSETYKNHVQANQQWLSFASFPFNKILHKKPCLDLNHRRGGDRCLIDTFAQMKMEIYDADTGFLNSDDHFVTYYFSLGSEAGIRTHRASSSYPTGVKPRGFYRPSYLSSYRYEQIWYTAPGEEAHIDMDQDETFYMKMEFEC